MGNGHANTVRSFRADFHIHTVLSPCAEVEMIPPFIISEARQRRIDLIAITDHNSTANVTAVQKAADGNGITVIPGMELQTREEVHAICLFETLDQLNAWQEIVTESLPKQSNKVDFFGEQFIVDETGEFIRRETQLLLTSSVLSFDQACQKVHDLGGIFFPAHVDRRAFGLIANLGFVPADTPIDAVELSRHARISESAEKYPQVRGYPILQNGDAHCLNDMLGAMEFWMESPTFGEVVKALKSQEGRKYSISENPN